jgi:plasmid stabilization system protein ParE
MVKRKINWSKRSQIKISEILQYYAERNGNKRYSIKLYSKISRSIKLLEKHPDIGHKSEFDSIRGLIVDSFIIFYENKPEETIIHTIWDCKQNPGNLKIK